MDDNKAAFKEIFESIENFLEDGWNNYFSADGVYSENRIKDYLETLAARDRLNQASGSVRAKAKDYINQFDELLQLHHQYGMMLVNAVNGDLIDDSILQRVQTCLGVTSDSVEYLERKKKELQRYV